MIDAKGQQIDIRTLPPQQLEQVRHTIDNEIQTFSAAMENFEAVMKRYVGARGTLKDTNKVLIDIGTNYFVEKTRGDADDFCKRKIEMLRNEMEKISPVLKSRYESKEVIDETIINYQKQMAAQKAQAAKAGK